MVVLPLLSVPRVAMPAPAVPAAIATAIIVTSMTGTVIVVARRALRMSEVAMAQVQALLGLGLQQYRCRSSWLKQAHREVRRHSRKQCIKRRGVDYRCSPAQMKVMATVRDRRTKIQARTKARVWKSAQAEGQSENIHVGKMAKPQHKHKQFRLRQLSLHLSLSIASAGASATTRMHTCICTTQTRTRAPRAPDR